MAGEVTYRRAVPDDLPGISALIPTAARGLSTGWYSPEQIEGAIEYVFGPDSQLIADGTYWVAEADHRLVGCGGWSRRATLYGGDQMKGALDPLVDPESDPARIRAFFTHPDWARRGIGGGILTRCMDAARGAGFRRLELMSTLPGVPLYRRYGFEEAEPVRTRLPNGVELSLVRMVRDVPGGGDRGSLPRSHTRRSLMTVTVTGSTGSVGAELVRLLAESNIPVRAVLRNTARARPLTGVSWHQADLSDAARLDSALEGTTRLFLLTGIEPGFGELQSAVIRAAERMGVKQVVKLSALGASADSRSPLAREHWEAEQALEQSGMTWTMLRPHSFMQNWLSGVAPTVRAGRAIYSAVGDGRVPFIDARDVAAVAARVLMDPDAHAGKKHVLTGGEAIGYVDLAAALSDELGTTVTYYPLSPDEERVRLLKIGIPDEIVESLLALAAYQKAGGPTARVSDSVERILGRAPRTAREFVRDYRAAFAEAGEGEGEGEGEGAAGVHLT